MPLCHLLLRVVLCSAALLPLGVLAEEPAHAGVPVTFCVDPDWPPFERINAQGEHEGIAADLLALAARRAGLSLQLRPTRSWEESMAASRVGECRILSFLNQTPVRDGWLIFTEPVYRDANVLITREEHPLINDLAALGEASIVLPRGTMVEERVRQDYPRLRVLLTDTEAQALAMVSNRQADMTLRSLTVAAATIRQEGWFNLKIAGRVPAYDNVMRIGVRRGDEALRDQLNRGVAEIRASEVNAIVNRHVGLRVEAAPDYALIGRVVLVFVLILGSNLFWALRLRRANQRLQQLSRTDALTGLANRFELNRRLLEYHARAERYQRPLAVIMFDLDHFKAINDAHGHLTGDRVLQTFAGCVQASVRVTDCAGRWGGEEFLVLCPDASAEQAAAFAERICAATRALRPTLDLAISVSAGVAALDTDESVDSLLQRADEALYAAKSGGRDRVCVAP